MTVAAYFWGGPWHGRSQVLPYDRPDPHFHIAVVSAMPPIFSKYDSLPPPKVRQTSYVLVSPDPARTIYVHASLLGNPRNN